jgi:two-component system response regulator FixJ
MTSLPPTSAHKTTLPTSAEKAVVVIVDDDLAVLTSLKFALELEGYEVRTFADAQSLLRNPAAGCNAQLIIDYHLPDTDGFDLLERLQAKGVRSPAVLITSQPSERLVRRAATLQIPIVEKPFLDNSLIIALRAQRNANAETEDGDKQPR